MKQLMLLFKGLLTPTAWMFVWIYLLNPVTTDNINVKELWVVETILYIIPCAYLIAFFLVNYTLIVMWDILIPVSIVEFNRQ